MSENTEFGSFLLVLLMSLPIILTCAVIAMIIGYLKGEPLKGFLFGLLGPIGIIIALVRKGPGSPCPACKTHIPYDEVICPNCRHAVPSLASDRTSDNTDIERSPQS